MGYERKKNNKADYGSLLDGESGAYRAWYIFFGQRYKK